MSKKLLEVRGLRKTFPVKASPFSGKSLSLKAVDGVDLDIMKGETLGLVGESGCGKTTIGRCLLRLYEPDSGRVYLDPDQHRQTITEVDAIDLEYAEKLSMIEERSGEKSFAAKREMRKLQHSADQIKHRADYIARKADILSMNRHDLKAARQRIQMIFQDPWASLNPMMLVKDLIAEGPREFKTHNGPQLNRWVNELLDKVGLPRTAANRYPHEFSGGQRQRICIARALALTPSLIVCDEPVSALDVSIQAQVLNLLISLQDDFDLTFVFIAHDLSVVQYISDRIAVMYLGKMAENSEASDLYRNPRHPYTISLLSSIPVADPDYKSSGIILQGDVPSPVNPPPGCSFHPRCQYATEICKQVTPQLEDKAKGHIIACHNPPNG
ncbi:ABC transporter ATP-binding protein [Spirochaeta dissipatitropha]